jgi:hypothetical protein
MLFGLGPVEIATIVVVGCAVEVVLLWAAAALADAPEIGWGKFGVVGSGVFLGLFAAACGMAFALGLLEKPTTGENRLPTLGAAAGLTLLVALVAPGLAYPMTLPVSLRRGLWVSVLQWLLRLFLYALITALVMVVIAVIQIWRGP